MFLCSFGSERSEKNNNNWSNIANKCVKHVAIYVSCLLSVEFKSCFGNHYANQDKSKTDSGMNEGIY